MIWKRILLLSLFTCLVLPSSSIDSNVLRLLHGNISDFFSFTRFYTRLLHDTRQHRPIDTVSSPIDPTRIKSNNYSEEYLKNSVKISDADDIICMFSFQCYQNAADLLDAHGYNRSHLQLSVNDIQSLLPALLYSVINPGCEPRSPPSKRQPFLTGNLFPDMRRKMFDKWFSCSLDRRSDAHGDYEIISCRHLLFPRWSSSAIGQTPPLVRSQFECFYMWCYAWNDRLSFDSSRRHRRRSRVFDLNLFSAACRFINCPMKSTTTIISTEAQRFFAVFSFSSSWRKFFDFASMSIR